MQICRSDGSPSHVSQLTLSWFVTNPFQTNPLDDQTAAVKDNCLRTECFLAQDQEDERHQSVQV